MLPEVNMRAIGYKDGVKNKKMNYFFVSHCRKAEVRFLLTTIVSLKSMDIFTTYLRGK